MCALSFIFKESFPLLVRVFIPGTEYYQTLQVNNNKKKSQDLLVGRSYFVFLTITSSFTRQVDYFIVLDSLLFVLVHMGKMSQQRCYFNCWRPETTKLGWSLLGLNSSSSLCNRKGINPAWPANLRDCVQFSLNSPQAGPTILHPTIGGISEGQIIPWINCYSYFNFPPK